MRLSRLGLVCLAVLLSADAALAQLKATTYVATGLSLPVAFIQDTADTANQYVVEQGGRIRLLRNGVIQSTDFLDLSMEISTGGERGLLGMALAPDWASSGRFFVNYTNSSGHTVVERFKRSMSNPLRADTSAGARKKLVWSTGQAFITQPFSNHNGGNIAFGPDGFLYIGMGDGGSANDPDNYAQRTNTLLGKMLRIDTSVADNHSTGFAIPATNPFAGSTCATVCPEIWSIGLRNPWRWSFDDPLRGGTGALIIGDVGQGAREEIDYEPAGRGGRNYGWRIREGTIATSGIPGTTAPSTFPTLTEPIHDYGRNSGASTTGGLVYRGTAIPAYVGRYFFGDFVSGRIWSLRLTINATTGEATASDLQDHTTQLGSSSVSTFGVDANGELYFANYSNGRIYRIESAGPTMTLDKTVLGFGAVVANQVFVRQTPAQTVGLSQVEATPTSWTVSSGAPWLVVSPSSGTGSGTVSVSVQFASGLSTGSQTANLTFTFGGTGGVTRTLPVTLRVAIGSSAAPFGEFDTPINGTTNVAGSIAVTGWALDDIELSRVRIWRDPAGSEPAGLVFIGDATLVAGARPDVQTIYPTFPLAARAGFGYLLLTNFLPSLGNGTFRLYAIAEDGEGRTTTLGTKTITVNNAGSSAPFGAIDTPAQGGTATGALTNFGWVLSPNPRRADPPGGGSVQIAIDGAIIGAVPSGWTSRSDITALFPAAQFPGVATAVGNAALDTTSLSNGVHTIAWIVTDNLGNASGVGSRYFTVSNGASALSAECSVLGAGCAVRAQRQAHSTQQMELNTPEPARSTLSGRRGFDPWAAYEAFEPDANGVIAIQIAELDRLELWAGEGASGYLLVGGVKQALPIGSRLDPETGQFTWNPGVGFVGTYDLVLGGRRVQVTIGAK